MKSHIIYFLLALCVYLTACSDPFSAGWGYSAPPACTFGWLQADKGAEFRYVQLLVPNYDGHCYTCFNNPSFNNNAYFPNFSLNMIMWNARAGIYGQSTCEFLWKANVIKSHCTIPADSIMCTQDDYDSYFCS